MDSGAPDLAASLGSRFLEVDVWLEGDFGECFLSIPRAFAVRKEKFDYRGVVLDTAWAVSQTAPGDALWVVHILGLLGNTPSLKTILRHAKAKPEALSSFLPGWMDCVGGRADEQGVRLYEEALDLIPSQQERASYVRKFGEVHPEGYLLLLNRKDLTAEERYSLGMEALDRIGAEYRVRADVALKTADLALELEKGADAAEKCWLAAFESDTNGENWLRVFLNSRNPEESREKMKAVLENLPAEVRPEPGPEYPYRKRNCPSRNMRYALRFLQGEFLPVLQEAMTGKPSLGWSKTFLKQGYALYLSAIYEGPDLPECVADLYRDAEWALNFDPARYRRGLAPSQVEDDALFETCFRQWRTTAVWPEGAKEKILTRLEKRMEKRTEAIVKAGKVVCYRECARYAAAIGETWESLGKQGAKNRILNFYGRNFPRRRDLKAALRGYGWQG